jgi:2-dehydro-3-deoxygalactonokinase
MVPPFVSCDWGTTNFRLRWIEGGAARAEVRSDDGAAKLAAAGTDRPRAFREVLARARERLAAPPDLPVVVSGMAGSSIGWKELPYAELPFSLDGSDAVREEIEPGVHLLSGLRSGTDVMRGEETEAIGAAALLGRDLPEPAVLIKPGTHSKHLELREGRVVGFRSYMTGEIFDVLARHSVLRHSVDPQAPFDREAFLEGVREFQRSPLTSALFRVRTRQVLDGGTPASGAWFLSGMLVAQEWDVLRGPGGDLVLCAGEPLRSAYALAARELGLKRRLSAVEAERLAFLGQGVVLERLGAGR